MVTKESRKEKERNFRRKIIADAAERLFSANTFEFVTMEDIASEAEFAKGTLYQYFNSKDDIFAYVICRSIDEICEKIKKECLSEQTGQESLEKLIAIYYEYLQERKNLYISFIRLQLSNALPEEIVTRVTNSHQQKMKLVQQVIERGLEEKIFLHEDAQMLLKTIDGIVRGFNFTFISDEYVIDREESIGLIKKVLFGGILAKRGR
ncbi:MAG: TetR/AcrR family transcriptional regulator [Bacillota bacterium]